MNDETRQIADLEMENKDLKGDLKRLSKQFYEHTNMMNVPCAEALERIWAEVFPFDYGPWEYPGMAANHIVHLVKELRSENARLFDVKVAQRND